MSRDAVSKLASLAGPRIVATSDFRGDDEARVSPKDWLDVARLLRDELGFDHFLDLTAVDYPEREPERARFDVVLRIRSSSTRARIALRTEVEDGKSLASVTSIWSGAGWAEREVFDMFGVPFDGHPDLRRILMYDEFVGHPLRKDYPIDRAQPLVPYRDIPSVTKLAPFGIEEGQPFARIRWDERLAGTDQQVAPSIAQQLGQRRVLSDSGIAVEQQAALEKKLAQEAAAAEAAAAAAATGEPKAGG